jgi:ACS family glucarate transporter-like MFS transporter
VFILAFITILDRVCISSSKLDIASDLHVTDLQFGWVFAAFTIGYAVFLIPGGWCADLLGPRSVLAVIVCCWSLFTIWTGSATNLEQLIIIRLMFGLAEAGTYPGASRALYGWVPVSQRGVAFGLLNAGSRLGAALGLPLASFTVVWFGWRNSFRILGGAGLLWALWWYWAYRNYPVAPAQTKPYPAQNQKPGDQSHPPVVPTWRSILFSKSGSLLLFQYFANNFSFFVVYSWMLPYLERRFGLAPSAAGIYSGMPLYGGLMATCSGGLFVDHLFRRGYLGWSRALPGVIGFCLAAFGVLLAGIAQEPFWFVLAFATVMFGLDLTVSSSWTLAVELGPDRVGVVSGAMNMAGALGSFSCSVAFPYIFNWTGHEEGFFLLAATLNVAGAISWYQLSRCPTALTTASVQG